MLEHEMLYGESFPVPEVSDHLEKIGVARVVREGNDVTLVCFSRGVKWSLIAAESLSERGIQAEVIDLRTLRPIDIETVLKSVRKTNRMVAVDEGWPFGSIASELSAQIMEHAFDYLDAPVMRVTAEDVPLAYAENLEQNSLPNPDRIFEAVMRTDPH